MTVRLFDVRISCFNHVKIEMMLLNFQHDEGSIKQVFSVTAACKLMYVTIVMVFLNVVHAWLF